MAQVWFGASGINGGGGTQWGGANVYISVDDVTYSQIAVLTAPLRQGFLTASLPAAGGWDSVDTLGGQPRRERRHALRHVAGGGAGRRDAVAGRQRADRLRDGHADSGNAYNLTGLARGLGGSAGAAHSSGAPFARLDGAVARYDLPANFVGQTIYFKFQSFNVFGGGPRTSRPARSTRSRRSTLPRSSPRRRRHTPPTPPADPIAAQLLTGFAFNLGSVKSAPTIADNFGSVTGGVVDVINLGAVAVTATHPIAVQLLSGSPLNLGATTSYPSVTDNFGSVNDAVSQTIDLGYLDSLSSRKSLDGTAEWDWLGA